MFTYIKELVIGISLLILGAYPFLLNISGFETWISDSSFLSTLLPGEWLFNIILIVMGILILIKRIHLRTTH